MGKKGTWKRAFSGLMAAFIVTATVFSPLSVCAQEDDVEEKRPLLYDTLDEDETVKTEETAGEGQAVTEDLSVSETEGNETPSVSEEPVQDSEATGETQTPADIPADGSSDDNAAERIPEETVPERTETQEKGEFAGSETQEAKESAESDEPETRESVTEPVESWLPEEPEIIPESNTEWQNKPETETEVFPAVGTEPEKEPETETESETETETETESEEGYQVTVTKGSELGVILDREDGRYQPGDNMQFYTGLPAGSLTAAGALKVAANAQGDTADILYSEVTYHPDTDMFSFEMPADDINLEVAQDYAEGSIMAISSSGDDMPWDEATDVEADTYYYYSDGQLHPFDSAMGRGGNDSYKYVRYKVNGKTYTVYAYCMQHSMPAPPSGTTYRNMIDLDESGDDKYLRKAMFYGFGGPGWGQTFNGHNIQSIMTNAGCFSETRAMQHYLVDYLYDGESGFGGSLSETAKNMLREIKLALKEMPDPSAVKLLPDLSVKANGKNTETFTWKANEAFTITIQLEKGVSIVNETTGETSTGKVTVKGGDKFHLTATTDNVSSLSGNYAVTSNYPLNFHAMLLRLQNSQDIGFGYYTDSTDIFLEVDWPVQAAELDIVKMDAESGTRLAGAVYGIYREETCQNLIMQMPPTDENGLASVALDAGDSTVVYLKELIAPEGYLLDTSAIEWEASSRSVTTQVLTDMENLGNLKIYKEGEAIVGAVPDGDGITFQYINRRLTDAVYTVTAAENIQAADGRTVLQKGEEVAAGIKTREDGSAVLHSLHPGKYTVTETRAPEGYVNTGEEKTVTVTAEGMDAYTEVTFQNDRQKAEVTVVKQDTETSAPLAGGIYGLFAAGDIRNADGVVVVNKDTLIGKATTGADGRASYTADLPIGFSYYIKELQAPDGYMRNQGDVYQFTFSYTHDTEAAVSFSHTFENERVRAKISLTKRDAETGETPQGDAVLGKAVYGLYAREDIVHPDKRTGVIHKAGTQVATLTTDENGEASIGDLYLGKYYVKEITPSVGYLLDETEHDLSCDFEGDLAAVVERTATSPEQVIKQPFQLIKAANNGKTDADLLSGAGFTAWLVSSLPAKEDGSYDFASAVPAVIGEDGATEIFTDDKGRAVSIAIPYGTYLVRETTTPRNYKPVNDFLVRITEHHPTEPQVWRVLLDDEFKAKLKIIKQDDETKKPVLVAGTEFKVYDLDNGRYVEQVTTYPSTVTHTSFFTDSDGYLILPQNLLAGNYRIEEVTAPDGYTLDGNAVEVRVDSDTMYRMDSVSGDAIIEAVQENHPVKGKLRVIKKGEVLAGYGKEFVYEEQPIAGAVFAVTAAENIYTADYQKDVDGNRICRYQEDELVAELTTGEGGEAVLADLPLGRYRVAETKAPEGYVLNDEAQEVFFEYADQETPVVEQTAEFADERQRVRIKAVKKDAENEAALAGAVFGLYAKKDITAGGKVTVPADTLLSEAESGEDGCAVFGTDLPFGAYYLRELRAPAGYLSNAEIKEITASYQGQEITVAEFAAEFTDRPTVAEFTKSDLTTGVELDGASLTVLDQDGNAVDAWTSVRDQPHVVKRLHVGKTYTLREEFAPYGYLKAEEVKFTVEDIEEVQKVEMKDAVPTALLIINKYGEFLNKVTLMDHAKNTLYHLLEYVVGSLPEVTFEVYAAEDIRAADGTSADYYKANELVGTITTDAGGIARLGDLPVGKYYVKEAETAHGFVLDGEPRYIDLSYRDQNTPIVTYSEAWQNARQKAKVHILKKEKNGDRLLAGGVFGLYAAEDIRSAGGEVLLKKDTLIEQRTTDKKGEISFLADLPVDGSFYIQESKAPDGFVTSEEKREFVFEYAGEGQEEKVFEFVFEDEPTTVDLTKTDLTAGKELPGAHLRVIKENGDLVDEWISGKESHIIKELTVGETYELIETKPADGYVTAESIVFTVENTAEIQKHRMEDDVTKVSISKTDVTGKQEVPGARLTILDGDDQVVERWISGDEPYYVEKLPVGSYKLREEWAPEGYVLAEDADFSVSDTGEIQVAQMKNYTAKGKVILNKTDKETGKPLAGVEFELRNGKGEVLETLKTDAAGHAESGLYEIASYKGGVYDEAICYYLTETKTLDGYVPDDMKYEILFDYEGQFIPVIEVKLDITNDPALESALMARSKAAQTGDETPLVLMLFLMAGAAGVIVLLLVKRRRRA